MDNFYENVNIITYNNISEGGTDETLKLHTSVDITPNKNDNSDIFTYLPRIENIPCDKFGYEYNVVGDEENGGKKLSYTTETTIFNKESDGSYKYTNGMSCDSNGYVLENNANYKLNKDGEKYKLFVNLSPCDYKVINDSNWIRTYKEDSIEIPCDLDGYVYAVDDYGNKIKYHGYTKQTLDGGVNYFYTKQVSQSSGINAYKTLCDVDGYVYTKDWVKYSENFPDKTQMNEMIKYKDAKHCFYIKDYSLKIKVDENKQQKRKDKIKLLQKPSEKERIIEFSQNGSSSQYCEFDVKNKQNITIDTLDKNYQMYSLEITKTNISINNLSPNSYDFVIPLKSNITPELVINKNQRRVYDETTGLYIDNTPCDKEGYVYDVNEGEEKYNVVYSSSDGITQLDVKYDETTGYYYQDGDNKIPCDENGYVYAVNGETNDIYKLFEDSDNDGIYEYIDGTLCDENGYVYAVNYQDEFIGKNIYDFSGIYSYIDENNLYVGLSKNKTNVELSYTVTLNGNIQLSLKQRPCVNCIDVITTNEWYTMTDVVEGNHEVKFKYCDNEGHIYKTQKLKKECVLKPYFYFYEDGTPCDEEGYVLSDSGDFELKDGKKYKIIDMFILHDKLFFYQNGVNKIPCDENGYIYDVDSGGAIYTTFKKIANNQYQYLDGTPCDENGYIYDVDSGQKVIKNIVKYNDEETGYYYEVSGKKIPCDENGYVYAVDEYGNKITKIVENSTTKIYRSDYGELCDKNGFVCNVENNGVINGITNNKVWEETESGNFKYSNEIFCDENGCVLKYNNFKVFNKFDENKHSYIDGTPCDENGYFYDLDENFRKKRKIKFNEGDVTCQIISHITKKDEEITTKGIYTCNIGNVDYACDEIGYKLTTEIKDGKYTSSTNDRCIEQRSQFDYQYLDGTPCDKNGYIFYNDNNIKKRKIEESAEKNEYIFDNRIICDAYGFIYDLNEDNEKYTAYIEERVFIDYKDDNDKVVDKDGYVYDVDANSKLKIDNTTQFNIFNNEVFYYSNPVSSESKEYTITLSDDRDYVYIPFISFNNLGQKLFLKTNEMVNIANVEQIIPPKEIENYDKIIIYKVYIEDLEEKSTTIKFTYNNNNFKFKIVKN